MDHHNLPDLSRKRKDRDDLDEDEFMHEADFIRCIQDAIESNLVYKKQALRLGIFTPLKHDSAFDLSRGRFVRPLSCLSSPRPRQGLSLLEQLPMEIKLNIVMFLQQTTQYGGAVYPNLDILAMHFTSKTVAAETMDQHNHVVGFDTKEAFTSSVKEFNDKYPLEVLICATCKIPKDLAADGFNDDSFELYYTQRQCLPCSLGKRIGITIYIKKVPYFACTACGVMQPTYGATWRQDAKAPEWCTIKDKVVQACFDSPPHPSLHANPDAQSRERVCKSCFIKSRAIFADQSLGCLCVRCTGESASVIVSGAEDLS